MRLLCWLDRLIFYLDPRSGGIEYDGHVRGEPVFVRDGDREVEMNRCVRCRRFLVDGWRSM